MHDTQCAQISQKKNGCNIYVYMQSLSFHDYIKYLCDYKYIYKVI